MSGVITRRQRKQKNQGQVGLVLEVQICGEMRSKIQILRIFYRYVLYVVICATLCQKRTAGKQVDFIFPQVFAWIITNARKI